MSQGEPSAARLTPEMVSFRALVLEFVAGYVARWGQSPSYGEIAAGTNSNRTRVKRALVSLERKGLLLRAGGVRGLSLPDDIEQALKTLERAGVLKPGELKAGKQDTSGRPGEAASASARPQLLARSAKRSEEAGAEAPAQPSSVTKPTLLPPAALDYPAPINDGYGEQQRDGNSTDR